MKRHFDKMTAAKLKHYVYTYSDPRKGREKVFYVGQGKNNRCFEHLDNEKNAEFQDRVKAIKSEGLEPLIDILADGLSNDQASAIEAAIIETCGVNNLINKVRGKELRKRSVEDVIREHNVEAVNLDNLAFNDLAISVNSTYPSIDSHNPFELYEITRAAWYFGNLPHEAQNANETPYAVAVFKNHVVEVYEIAAWFSADSIMHSRGYEDSSRLAFVGKFAGNCIREIFIDKCLPPRKQGEANPLQLLRRSL